MGTGSLPFGCLPLPTVCRSYFRTLCNHGQCANLPPPTNQPARLKKKSFACAPRAKPEEHIAGRVPRRDVSLVMRSHRCASARPVSEKGAKGPSRPHKVPKRQADLEQAVLQDVSSKNDLHLLIIKHIRVQHSIVLAGTQAGRAKYLQSSFRLHARCYRASQLHG